MRILKNVLEGITGVEVSIMLIAASAMDSDDMTVPIVLMVQALIWLVLVGSRLDWDSEDNGKEIRHEKHTSRP